MIKREIEEKGLDEDSMKSRNSLCGVYSPVSKEASCAYQAKTMPLFLWIGRRNILKEHEPNEILSHHHHIS